MLNNWLLLSLISAIGFGVVPLFLKSIEQFVSPQITIAIYYSFASIILWIIAFATTKVKMPDSRHFIPILIVALIAAVSDLAIFYAYKVASNAGFPRSVQALSILIATVLSAVLYRQFPGTIGVLGTILVLSGVVVLSFIK